MRRTIPSEVETQLLQLSRRRCCVCFGLDNDFERKKGQIAHLDGDASNNRLDNLAWLCLDHHDEYDSQTSQSKGLKRPEVIGYRDELYHAVAEFLGSNRGREESLLSSSGELDYYLVTFDSAQQVGVTALQRVRAASATLVRRLKAANDTATRDLASGKAPQSGFRRWEDQTAKALNEFARSLQRDVDEIGRAGKRLLDALSRAAAVASDIEFADEKLFLGKLAELSGYGENLFQAMEGARETRDEVRVLKRGSVKLNRSRRLSFSALDEFARMAESQLPEVKRHEEHLRTVISLL